MTIGTHRVLSTVAALAALTTLGMTACGSQNSSNSSGTSSAASGSSASSSAAPPAAAPIAVVAAENFWGDIAKQIGGDHVAVTSIISDPNADPHQYESDANTAAAVSKAQLVVDNGLGYDDFMDKLFSASPNPNRKVITAAEVMGISGDDANPHIWYDTAKVPDVANAIAGQLGALDPTDAAMFTANAKTFNDSLTPINDAIANIKTKYPDAPVGYTERVPGYLVDAAGLKLATPASFAQSIEDGNDPSPADNQAMDNDMKTKAIKVLLYNGQVTSPATDAVKSLAQQSGIPIVGVTETLPPTDKDFQTWQLRQINEITNALAH
ncbi:metal ABC transporter solute-binding protein, Zn/Mn family [Mycobacterium sp. 141]|uniref:metal ABC transporter solute-binding protein, Zn/Mn family n=1 Tax=Mycobacterium sp. 141 TaxID=1120797 RepID=UPI0012DE704C|nr:zinc ABC transporter substrate-binding protein [Mycobacterium sp. 141]